MTGLAEPPRWSAAELDAWRTAALADFVAQRGREGTEAYAAAFRRLRPLVEQVFAATDDLRSWSPQLLLEHPALVSPMRYLIAPLISADDLDTLVEGRTRNKRIDAGVAERIVTLVESGLDPVRYPWLVERRGASDQERSSAIEWTTGVWASEQVRTARKTESSRRQEAAVADLLRNVGYEYGPHRRMTALDDMPRGTFGGEAVLAGAKADVPVRLHDGRLLAIECKVSNSAVNSVKRLLRETGGKARAWREAYGEQVVPAAVLSGVFKLNDLLAAQENHRIALFWETDLSPLAHFLTARGDAPGTAHAGS